MKFNPKIHHRRSIRLKGYDYTQAGAYFVTIVVWQRECLFGEIVDGEMRLSPMGQIAEEHWRAIPDHFPYVELGAYVIMPNHVHGIIVIHPVGATQWVAPTTTANGPKRGSIGAIIGAYKSSVTRRIQNELNETAVWQRNYYEHIIRNEAEYHRIHRYIESNVENWINDNENPVKSK